MTEEHRGTPRVGDLFQQAVQAQLAEQQAQRESIAEFSRRLEVSERLMTDGLGAITKVLTASEHALEKLAERLTRIEDVIAAEPASPDPTLSAAAASRIDACEAALVERLEAIDHSDQVEGIAQRMAAMEASVGERLGALWDTLSTGIELLAKNIESAGGHHEAALEEARRSREGLRSRLTDLEGTVRKVEEQTTAHMVELRDASAATEVHLVELRDASAATEAQLVELRDASAATEAQLVELRDASVAAEAGILERIILESQTVATHFETVRPAVEAVAQAGPELETTLNELRELAERVASDDSGETGPYSAEELLAPHEDDDHSPLFQPPEETKIPERRFWGRDR